MNETSLLLVVGLALLPAAGNFAGGLAAEWVDASKPFLNRALHAAAGVVIGVVAIELTPRALDSTSGWVVGLAFFGGAVLYVLVEALVERLTGPDSGGPRAWMIYVAVGVDLFGDGLLIGTGSSVSSSFAFVLALGQVLADIPEGFAAIVNLRDKGLSRRRRLAFSASFALPVLVAALASYALLRGRAESLQMGALMLTAGMLTVAAVEDMIVEAHEAAEDSRGATLAFAAGFALFAIVSASIGGGNGP